MPSAGRLNLLRLSKNPPRATRLASSVTRLASRATRLAIRVTRLSICVVRLAMAPSAPRALLPKGAQTANVCAAGIVGSETYLRQEETSRTL
jgi:hypothetical protein